MGLPPLEDGPVKLIETVLDEFANVAVTPVGELGTVVAPDQAATVIDCVTRGATLKFVLPAWSAAIVQTPASMSVTSPVALSTVQIAVVRLL